jgi:hypothetical protein
VIDKWCKDFKEKVNAKGLDIKKWYMWYTLVQNVQKIREKLCGYNLPSDSVSRIK